MAYNFQSRLDHIGKRRKEYDSELIDYIPSTGEATIPNILASFGRTQAEEMIDGIPITVVDRQRIVIDTTAITSLNREPIPGDIIVRKSFTGSPRFRVSSIGGKDTACYNYTTPSRKRISIYTEEWDKWPM